MTKCVLRMCVACRQHKPSLEMTRVVRLGTEAKIDPTQKANGRGAYVCVDPACVKKCIKGILFNRALSVAVSEDVYTALPTGIKLKEIADE